MPSLRLTSENDRHAFYQLYLYAFNQIDSPARQAFFNYRYDHGWIYGNHKGDQLTSGLYSLPFQVGFHGVTYHMHGIGDVMTAPEYAGQGGASTLIRAALAEMLAHRVELSYLAPFSYRYYRRFGYEHVFDHAVYRLAHDKVPPYRTPQTRGQIKRLTLAQALPQIKPLYASHTAQLRGGLIREDWWWHYLTLKRQWDVALFEDAQAKLQGYMIYERTTMSMICHEFLAQTPEAQQQLTGFFLRHANSFETLIYEAPDIKPLGDWFPEAGDLETTLKPDMMARIVDLASFIERYPFTKATFAPMTLAISDPVLVANQGTWQLSRQTGHTQFQQVSTDLRTDATLHLDIQQLTQLCFGTTTAEQARMRGTIQTTQSGATAFDQVVVHTPPSLNDYF